MKHPLLRARRFHHDGFSLVELMVSVVIGLLAVLLATRIMTDNQRNKDAALGGSDSMQNGMLAMFSISGDIEQAGYGLNDPLLVGCNTRFTDSGGYQLASARRGEANVRPLAPAIIEPGGDEASDRITLYAGSAAGGTATLRLTGNYVGGTTLNVDRRPYGFRLGDVIVVAPEQAGGDCALAQLATDPETHPVPPAAQYVRIGGSGLRFNSGALGVQYQGNTARIFNLGQGARLAFHTWSVEGNYLRLRSTDMDGAGANPQAVADNIVLLKAQYGFDTRAGQAFQPTQGTQVGEWSSTMIDADGDGVKGSAGDYGRVVALRLALVARARHPERPAADGKCSATIEIKPLFASEQPQGVEPQEVEVDLGTAADPDGWKCYRYRVFETIVPLRNALWRPA